MLLTFIIVIIKIYCVKRVSRDELILVLFAFEPYLLFFLSDHHLYHGIKIMVYDFMHILYGLFRQIIDLCMDLLALSVKDKVEHNKVLNFQNPSKQSEINLNYKTNFYILKF